MYLAYNLLQPSLSVRKPLNYRQFKWSGQTAQNLGSFYIYNTDSSTIQTALCGFDVLVKAAQL